MNDNDNKRHREDFGLKPPKRKAHAQWQGERNKKKQDDAAKRKREGK